MLKETIYSLQDFEKDHLWTQNQRKKLLSAYKNNWVAVRNQKVIDNDKDLKVLCSRLEDPGNTFVEYVTNKSLEMILWL